MENIAADIGRWYSDCSYLTVNVADNTISISSGEGAYGLLIGLDNDKGILDYDLDDFWYFDAKLKQEIVLLRRVEIL